MDRVFKMLDKNGDEAITISEFIKLLKQKASAGKLG
jgi:Ca2+-binding EF-hand superfamily protein